MNLSYLIYVSIQSRSLTQTDLNDILDVCSKNNLDKQITGMLLYVEGRFFQVLEGEENEINKLFENISKDKRHGNVTIVAKGQLDQRIFKDWSMRFNSISEVEFTSISGIGKFKNLFKLKPKEPQNPAWMFVRKFTDKTFPSPSWWKEMH